MYQLNEDKRQELINKSKHADNYVTDQSKGKNRYQRRVHSKVLNSVQEFNSIDMNSLFKDNILTVNVNVQGETDNYVVQIRFGGILDEIHDQLQRNNQKFDLKVVMRALIAAFNSDNVYIHCSCLHPDTKIKLLDGSTPTIAEMLDRFNSGEQLYVYSVDEKGDFKPGIVEKVWITKTTAEFIKVTLDNNQEIMTTPDHLYMLRDGSYKQAQTLIVGQSLMPLYFNVWQNGYDGIKLNSTGKYHSVYKLVANYFKSDEIEEATHRINESDNMKYDVAIHHKDFNKHNNNPENLIPMTAKEHWSYHANIPKHISETGKQHLSELMKERNNNPTEAMIKSRKSWQEKGRLRNYDEDRRQQQSELFKNIRKNETEEEKQYRQRRCKEGYIKNNSAEKMSIYKKAFWESKSTEEKTAIKLKSDRNRIGQYLNNILSDGLFPTPELADKYRVKYAPKWDKCFSSWDELITYFELNHKITNIEYVTLSDTPVYDIKIRDYENFLVDAGVILHNCPDWNYRFSYWSRVNDISSDPSIEQTNNGMEIVNPNDTKGRGCKHSLLVLSNNRWLRAVSSVIFNYVNYMEKHYPRLYADIIYPAIYEKEYEDDVQLDIFDTEETKDNLPDEQDEIDVSNKWAKTKGQFKPGNEYRFTSDETEVPGQKSFDFDSLISDS